MVVLAKENPTTPAVTLLVGVRAGASYDPDGREGTAALVGARPRPRHDRAPHPTSPTSARRPWCGAFGCRGASPADGKCHVSRGGLRRDSSRWPPTSSSIRCSTSARSKRAAAELLTAILQDEDDPGAVAVDLAMSRLYPHHPYGRGPRGSTESVCAIAPGRSRRLHRIWFTPKAPPWWWSATSARKKFVRSRVTRVRRAGRPPGRRSLPFPLVARARRARSCRRPDDEQGAGRRGLWLRRRAAADPATWQLR